MGFKLAEGQVWGIWGRETARAGKSQSKPSFPRFLVPLTPLCHALRRCFPPKDLQIPFSRLALALFAAAFHVCVRACVCVCECAATRQGGRESALPVPMVECSWLAGLVVLPDIAAPTCRCLFCGSGDPGRLSFPSDPSQVHHTVIFTRMEVAKKAETRKTDHGWRT